MGSPAMKRKATFFDTENGAEIKEILRTMVLDATYSTGPSYSANSEQFPDNLIPFVEKHMRYLTAHPNTDPWHYIANLRLMTRVR